MKRSKQFQLAGFIAAAIGMIVFIVGGKFMGIGLLVCCVGLLVFAAGRMME